MKRLSCVIVALVVVAACAAQAAANLLSNPGFESPTSTTTSMGNWFRFGSGPLGVAFDSNDMPHSGQGHVGIELGGSLQFAGVFQDLPVPVSPGQTVVFSGWNKSLLAPFNATRELKIEWVGAPQTRVDSFAMGADYEMFSLAAVAPAGTTGARVTYAISSFGTGQGAAQVYIDDFSAIVVPEPAAATLLGIGALGALCLRRRSLAVDRTKS